MSHRTMSLVRRCDFSVVASRWISESEQVVRVNTWNDQYERYRVG